MYFNELKILLQIYEEQNAIFYCLTVTPFNSFYAVGFIANYKQYNIILFNN